MNKELSLDEFDALEQISKLTKNIKPSVCVNRNAKRLSGIKFVQFRKDGQLEITNEGRAVLFAKNCIDGLRAIAANPQAPLSKDVIIFLSKKSFIETDSDGTHISQRGMECLADVDARNVLRK